MERRNFLKGLSAAGLLSMMDPAYLSAKGRLQSGETPTDPAPKRNYGRTKDLISIIGFGGIVVKDVTPEEAPNSLPRPWIGGQLLRRGPVLRQRPGAARPGAETLPPELLPGLQDDRTGCRAAKELEQSLSLLQTDHFDLYQLHALTTWRRSSKPSPGRGDGDVPEGQEGRQDPLHRLLGPQRRGRPRGHGPLRLRFDPVSAELPHLDQGRFGPSVYKRAKEAGWASSP